MKEFIARVVDLTVVAICLGIMVASHLNQPLARKR